MREQISLSLDELENRLHKVLRPITPPMEYLQRVRKRIRYSPSITTAHRLLEWEFWFIIIGGVVTGFMLLLTLTRALFYFFGRK